MKDKNEIELKNGDIININQTVNGENIFIIFKLNPLEIRYGSNLNYIYEYDMDELLNPNKYSGETEFEIVGNFYKKIEDIRKIKYNL